MANLYQRLEEYQKSDVYPFHMPGHKRRFGMKLCDREESGLQGTTLPYGIDITEIEGFDNLTEPGMGEILWQMCEDAKKLYGTKAVFPLVNGSTAGLMAAISAVAAPGDEIIIARNCHKAVYRTAELLGLAVTYIYPEYCGGSWLVSGIDAEKIERLLELHQTAKCVVITSPTYEGVILDVRQIAKLAHAHNMPLIVDEAHGAHLPFLSDNLMGDDKHLLYSSNLNKDRGGYSALYQNADIVVQSLHKTLPALTQTAVLHVTEGAEERGSVSIKRVESYVHLFQSTSPSYPLLASIDSCFSACARMVEDKTFDRYLIKLKEERKKYAGLKRLCLLDEKMAGGYAYDIGKLVFLTMGTNISGIELMDRLREEYRLELEMGAGNYAIAMTSVCDTDEGWDRLRHAIFEIDEILIGEKVGCKTGKRQNEASAAMMTIREAKERTVTMVMLEKLKKQMAQDYVTASTLPLGQVYQSWVSADYVMCYPPGTPILVPGECVTRSAIAEIEEAMKSGCSVIGVKDGKIAIVV